MAIQDRVGGDLLSLLTSHMGVPPRMKEFVQEHPYTPTHECHRIAVILGIFNFPDHLLLLCWRMEEREEMAGNHLAGSRKCGWGLTTAATFQEVVPNSILSYREAWRRPTIMQVENSKART